jgi:alpha-1,3-rhamnosyltransferase
MKTPLISVVIPNHNHGLFVESTIDSVVSQTLTDWELIVIDDGSSDDSVERIGRKLAGLPGDAQVRFIPRENRGICCTLNQALILARGVYFAYLGSDDLWEPTKLEKQLKALESEGRNVAAAYTDCYLVDADGRRFDRMGRQYNYRGGDIYRDLICMKFHPPSPTNLFVRKKVILSGGFNESIPIEDRDIWLRIARSYRIAYLDEPLASFRVHGKNTSTSYPERMTDSNLRTFDWAFRTDPALAPFRRKVLGELQAGTAAAHYASLNFSPARRAAAKALKLNVFNRIAWRILIRSFLGPSIVRKLRGIRADSRASGVNTNDSNPMPALRK